MQTVTLLGIPILSWGFSDVLKKVWTFLTDGKQHHLVTVNSEMFVESVYRPAFWKVLHRSSTNIPDSIGVVWMARFLRQKISERVPGVDLVQRLCEQLGPEHPVFFLGGRDGVGEKASVVLRAQNRTLRISGIYEGSPLEDEASVIMQRINAASPHILFVAFGAPQQDLWIARYIDKMPSVRVAMGVGGTFDFIAGVQKRAPYSFRCVGLEWLWRLLQEPQRVRRIWNAVVVFPWLVLRYGKASPHKVR